MQITATHINYYYICHRKLWLFANGINMEHTSQAVAEGKLLHDTAYPQRAEKYTEVALSFTLDSGVDIAGKIDFYDARNKVIHETKKSDSIEEAHEWQVKFYIWLLAQNGVVGATGMLEYPKLRHTSMVALTIEEALTLQQTVPEIATIVDSEQCPPRINSKICRRCSYFDFCYVEEL